MGCAMAPCGQPCAEKAAASRAMVQPKKKIATRKIKIFPNVRVKLCGRADIVVRADFEQRTRGLSMFSICDPTRTPGSRDIIKLVLGRF